MHVIMKKVLYLCVLGLLIGICDGCRKNASENTAVRSANGKRVVNAPTWPKIEISPGAHAGFGYFEVRPHVEWTGSLLSGPWEKIEVTNGVIEVPADVDLKLEIDSQNNTDLAALRAFMPDDLEVLALPLVNMIDSRAMPHIAHLTGLEALFLGGADIGDEDIGYLSGMSELKALSLQDCPLTDLSVEHIAKLKSLRILRLWGTAITKDGVRKLKKALPQCKIEWEERLRKPVSNTVDKNNTLPIPRPAS